MRAVCLALALLCSTSALAEDADRPWRPWFLPRYAVLGGYVPLNADAALSLFARVGWEITLLDQRTNLLLVLELGPGFGVATPGILRGFYQHAATFGFALKSPRYRKLQWGIQVTAGPVLEGAYLPTQGYNEQLWNGLVEGRAQVGFLNGPASYYFFIGIAQPWYSNFHQYTPSFVGGFEFGFAVDWR